MSRIAVFAFEDLSERPDSGCFARGFVEDVVRELGRFASLEVVHPSSSLAAHEEGDDSFARRLGAGFQLRGSVRRGADTLRVSARLVETGTRRQLWAAHYDVHAEELFSTQDEIAARVAAALAIEIDGARLRDARRRPPASLDAYECWVRGIDHLRRGTVEDDARARELFERALAIDPLFGRAHAGISLSHFNEWSCQAWELWDEKERLALEAARLAAELDPGDALTQVVLGRIHLYRREFDRAEGHVARALGLNPNDADVLAHAALCRTYLGDPEGALGLVDRAIALHPFHPGWFLFCAVAPLVLSGRHGEALARGAHFADVIVDLPAWLAAAAALAGDARRARSQLATFLASFEEKITFGRAPEPGEPLRWLLHVNPFRRDADEELFARALRLAGLQPDPDEGQSAAPAQDAPGSGELRRSGELWSVAFAGLRVQLRPLKGFQDLAALLAQPGKEIHCLELAGRPDEGGAEELLDARARAELGERLRELQRELDDARDAHDPGRSERAQRELDALAESLSRALGLGGRARRMGSAAERARSAVTWRIRSTIRKIAAAHPRLGHHLESAVRTGTFCVYAPETPVDWST